MSQLEIILLIAVIALGVFSIVLLAITLNNARKLKGYTRRDEKTDKVKVVDGVRYTKSATVSEQGKQTVSHLQGDIVLKRGEEYTVKKNGTVIPGKYTVLAADDKGEPFNLRIGGYVRKFTHNTPIVLDENEVICSVSHTVILR